MPSLQFFDNYHLTCTERGLPRQSPALAIPVSSLCMSWEWIKGPGVNLQDWENHGNQTCLQHPWDFGLCSTWVWNWGWVNIKNTMWSVTLCGDKLLLEELTIESFVSGEIPVTFLYFSNSTFRFGLNCILNPLLFIYFPLFVYWYCFY